MKIVLLALLFCASEVTHADDWSAAVGWASDYRVRGISLSNSRPTANADLSYRADTGWGAGLGLARLDRDAEGRRSLLSANLGRSWQLDADWSADLVLAHAHYPGGTTYRRAYRTDELSATLAWRGRLTATLMASPNTRRWDAVGMAHSGSAYSAELSLRQRLAGAVALDLGLGYVELNAEGSRGYPFGNVGLAATLGPAQAYLSYIASRAEQQHVAYGARARDGWVASLLWSF